MDKVKISGTKWYVDIEIQGNIARFSGEMGIDGFYAEINTMSWIKCNPRNELNFEQIAGCIDKENKKNPYKIYFIDEDGSVHK